MGILVRDGGVWKDSEPYVRDGGVWKPVDTGFVRDAGVWKEFYASWQPFVDDFEEWEGTGSTLRPVGWARVQSNNPDDLTRGTFRAWSGASYVVINEDLDTALPRIEREFDLSEASIIRLYVAELIRVTVDGVALPFASNVNTGVQGPYNNWFERTFDVSGFSGNHIVGIGADDFGSRGCFDLFSIE